MLVGVCVCIYTYKCAYTVINGQWCVCVCVC